MEEINRIVCLECKYWCEAGVSWNHAVEEGELAERDRFGQCRRYPPTPKLEEFSDDFFRELKEPERFKYTRNWPVTYAHDWCGEGVYTESDDRLNETMCSWAGRFR